MTLEPCAHRSARGPCCSSLLIEAGVRRVMQLLRDSATTDEALEAYAADCRAAGVELASA